ncbi:HAD family hydrolase [Geomesophilobacter sediminis]|uniref:phosphoglycolate phosphatase n=1 Tax=Geomesophilobacter sediminis TaxID=2798584 RepID=A0A8J7SBD4_9BACT|nr:HAD-IA family hydrolase [Geomesophilobacter sediminis]MBJ6727746.1 HAD-IA family hydrolase [Geomesophilobacter sediminis]
MRLLIFDLDGTLIDSLADLANATNQMLEHFSRPKLAVDEVRKLVGQGARRLVERALSGATPEEVDQALQLFLDFNLAHIADETRAYPGVAETLQKLGEKGYTCCVLSNKNVALCRQVLDTLGMSGLVSAIYGADSFPWRKPSPEPILALLKQYQVAPRDAAMIGDSINDIAAGSGAGVVTIGCSYGYGDRSELDGAEYVVGKFAELLQILN